MTRRPSECSKLTGGRFSPSSVGTRVKHLVMGRVLSSSKNRRSVAPRSDTSPSQQTPTHIQRVLSRRYSEAYAMENVHLLRAVQKDGGYVVGDGECSREHSLLRSRRPRRCDREGGQHRRRSMQRFWS